jgi:predicted ATP-grasp superfamily ATP-dependent carboligase
MFDGYFDAESRCLFRVTGRKIRQFPPYIGATCLGVCRANHALADQTEAFMQAIGYRGILDSGFKYDRRTGEYKLLDVNPRVGLNFRQFVDAAGMDVVRALYCHLTGQPVATGAFPEGRKWIVENNDLASSVVYWRDGKLKARQWPGTLHGVEEASWFAPDDVAPFFSMWRYSFRLLQQHLLSRARQGRRTAHPGDEPRVGVRVPRSTRSSAPLTDRKALVLGNDTRSFLSVIRSLGRAGVEVHIAWHDPDVPAARSRYVATPGSSPWSGSCAESTSTLFFLATTRASSHSSSIVTSSSPSARSIFSTSVPSKFCSTSSRRQSWPARSGSRFRGNG